jgi:hypothetical protein
MSAAIPYAGSAANLASKSAIVELAVVAHSPNENKMSDGWREGASLRVEGGISWNARNQGCQSFALSHG